MKKIIFFLFLIFAISASASYFPARFNPTGMMIVRGGMIERTEPVISPHKVVLRPGLSHVVYAVFPSLGKFTWSTDSDKFQVKPVTSDGRIGEVKGLKVGHGTLTVTDQRGKTAQIPIFVRR